MEPKIIRVFPRRTSLSPVDNMAFYGNPGMFIPDHDAVHICCIFTWDIEKAKRLQFQWQGQTPKPVLLDGPAFGNSGGDFIPGRYVRPGVVFTSRGCPRRCVWGDMKCLVPDREGPLRLLPIYPGNFINDNNFLACPKPHRRNVYDMFKTQRGIEFPGGLQGDILTDWDIEEMRSLRIRKMFFACDHDGAISMIKKTAARLYAAGFKRDNLHCYVVIGDDMTKNEARLRAVYAAGMLPRAQLYQPEKWVEYSTEWKNFGNLWQRPAKYRAKLKKETEDERKVY